MKEITDKAKGMLISEEDFLQAELAMGIGFHNKDFLNLAKEVAKIVRPLGKTILDYGAGTGVYADAYQKAGMETYVYEIFKPHRDYIQQNAPSLTIIDQPITTDVLSWIEVAEHMTDLEIAILLNSVAPRYILFSSTPQTTEWDAQWGHINVKQEAQWVSIFESFGYRKAKHLTFPTSWSMLLEKI